MKDIVQDMAAPPYISVDARGGSCTSTYHRSVHVAKFVSMHAQILERLTHLFTCRYEDGWVTARLVRVQLDSSRLLNHTEEVAEVFLETAYRNIKNPSRKESFPGK